MPTTRTLFIITFILGFVIGVVAYGALMGRRSFEEGPRLERLVLDSMTYSARMQDSEREKDGLRERIAELADIETSLTLALGHANQNRRTHPPRSADADSVRARILRQISVLHR